MTSSVRRELGLFVLVAVAALVVVAAAGVLVTRAISRDAAVDEAERRASTFANSVGAPLVTPGVLSGDRAARALLSTVMDNRLRVGSVRHINIWLADGTLLWSDDKSSVDHTFALDSPVRRLFGTHRTIGVSSPLDDSTDSAFRTSRDGLLEVYAAATAPDGTHLVIESYWSDDFIGRSAVRIMGQLLPLLLASLLLLTAPMLVLAYQLARRIDRTRRVNAQLMTQALAATELERYRVAADLHDGVLQDVGGASYALEALARTLGDDQPVARQIATEAGAMVRRVGSGLRTTLADIYPVDVSDGGLSGAVEDLVQPLRAAGLEVDVSMDPLLDLDTERLRLVYRLVREAVQNVHQHAEATSTRVRVAREREGIRVTVEDDGVGFEPAAARQGHFGMRLMRDTISMVGGTLSIQRVPAGGTQVVALIPDRGAVSSSDRTAHRPRRQAVMQRSRVVG